ncbi:hypothetical protein C8R44DRAFT_755481 [Mycena epipterygia]|nr:hypothetical protein C8R44DRAFT_755481 [Mycena epipterygia]
MYVVVDWRAQQYCKILCTNQGFNSDISMELIPGYLIFTSTHPSGRTQEMRVCSTSSLAAWTPVGQHNMTGALGLSNIPHVALSTIKIKGAPMGPGLIAVHENPLQRGTYRVWLSILRCVPRAREDSTYRALLCRFRLSLPQPGERQFTWRQQRCNPAEWNPRQHLGISFSGHTPAAYWSPAVNQRIIPPEVPPTPVIVEIPEGMDRVGTHVAPYSGALTYFTKDAFVLFYFE